MPREAYPDAADLSAFISSLSLNLSEEQAAALEARYAGAMDAAISSFREATGRVMLAEVTEARAFDPPTNPNGLLSFSADLASLVSVVVGGSTYVLGSDVRLWRPDGAPTDGPWWGLRFRRRWARPLSFVEEQSVIVTGLWGYATRLPDSVYQALLEKGAGNVWAQLQRAETGGLKSWREKDRGEDYGDQWASLNEQWTGKGCNFDRVVARYQKLEI